MAPGSRGLEMAHEAECLCRAHRSDGGACPQSGWVCLAGVLQGLTFLLLTRLCSALGPLATYHTWMDRGSCVSHLSGPWSRHCPTSPPSSSTPLLASLGQCPKHGALEPTERTSAAPLRDTCPLLPSWSMPGQGRLPTTSQAGELGDQKAASLQQQTILGSSPLAAANFMPL